MKALHLAHRVDGFALAFVVCAREYFADKAQGDELNAADDEEHGRKQ